MRPFALMLAFATAVSAQTPTPYLTVAGARISIGMTRRQVEAEISKTGLAMYYIGRDSVELMVARDSLTPAVADIEFATNRTVAQVKRYVGNRSHPLADLPALRQELWLEFERLRAGKSCVPSQRTDSKALGVYTTVSIRCGDVAYDVSQFTTSSFTGDLILAIVLGRQPSSTP